INFKSNHFSFLNLAIAFLASLTRLELRVYNEAMWPPRQPNQASSSASVKPAFANRVAHALRNPCAAPGTPAVLHASRNQLPKLSFVIGAPDGVAIKVKSPAFVAAITSRTGGGSSLHYLFNQRCHDAQNPEAINVDKHLRLVGHLLLTHCVRSPASFT